jgi:hypothetical protein
VPLSHPDHGPLLTFPVHGAGDARFSRLWRTIPGRSPPAPAQGEGVGRGLNRGAGRYVYVGGPKTMESAVPAAHGASPGAAALALPHPLLLIPALSVSIRR